MVDTHGVKGQVEAFWRLSVQRCGCGRGGELRLEECSHCHVHGQVRKSRGSRYPDFTLLPPSDLLRAPPIAASNLKPEGRGANVMVS